MLTVPPFFSFLSTQTECIFSSVKTVKKGYFPAFVCQCSSFQEKKPTDVCQISMHNKFVAVISQEERNKRTIVFYFLYPFFLTGFACFLFGHVGNTTGGSIFALFLNIS